VRAGWCCTKRGALGVVALGVLALNPRGVLELNLPGALEAKFRGAPWMLGVVRPAVLPLLMKLCAPGVTPRCVIAAAPPR
jgi:hypothetical protein